MASHRVDKRHKWHIFAIASANVRSTCGNTQCHRIIIQHVIRYVNILYFL